MASKEPLLKSDEEDLIFDQADMVNSRHSPSYSKNDSSICGNSISGRLQVARTVNLCLSFFGLGLCFAIPTATLEDLQHTVGADRRSIEYIYTARYGGYLFGSVLGGILFDRYNRQFLLFLSLLVTAVGIIVMPFCLRLAALMTCTAITGITMGFLDTGGNVWCLDLWGKKSAPFMQALHFCFGFGAFLAPLVAEPFLSPHLSNMTDTGGVDNFGNHTSTAIGISPIRIHRSKLLSEYNDGLHWPGAPVWNSATIQDDESHASDISALYPVKGLDHSRQSENFISSLFISDFKIQSRRLDRRDIALVGKEGEYNESRNEDERNLNFTFAGGNHSKDDAEGMVNSTVELGSRDSLAKTLPSGRINDDLSSNENSTALPADATTRHRPLPKPVITGGSLKHQENDPWQRPSLKKTGKDTSVKLLSSTVSSVTNTSVPNGGMSPTVTATMASHLTTELSLEVGRPNSSLSSLSNGTGDHPALTTTPHMHQPTDSPNETLMETITSLPPNFSQSVTLTSPLSTQSSSTTLKTSVMPTQLPMQSDFFTLSNVLHVPHSKFSSSTTTTAAASSPLSSLLPPTVAVSHSLTSSDNLVSTIKPTAGSMAVVYQNKSTSEGKEKILLPESIREEKNSGHSVQSLEPKNSLASEDVWVNHTKETTRSKEVHVEDYMPQPVYSAVSYKRPLSENSAIPNEHTTAITKIGFPKVKYEATPPPQILKFSTASSSHSSRKRLPTPSPSFSYGNDQVTKGSTDNNGKVSSTDPISLEHPIFPSHDEAFNESSQSNVSDSGGVDFLDNWFDFMRRNRLGKFELPYAILATYIFLVSVVFLFFLCLNPREPRTRQEEELDRGRHTTRTFKILLVGLASLFLCLYVGMQVAVGRLLQTFATTENLKLSTPRGYFLTYFFWGSFTVARGVSVAVSVRVGAVAMLFADLVVCLLASIILVAGSDKTEALLWVGIVLLGVGMASIFPTSIVWVERYVHVTNRTASAFILGAAFGEMVLPPLITRFIDEEPMVLMYVNVAVNVLCFVNFVALWLITSRAGEKYQRKPKRSLYQLANADEGEDDVEMCPPSARWQNDYNTRILSKRKVKETSPHYGGV